MPSKFGLKNAKALLPSRSLTANKISGGKSLIIAGSPGMVGAGVLAAKACYRAGAGYTYLYTKGDIDFTKVPEILQVQKLTSLNSFNAIGLGPGFTDHSRLDSILRKLMKFELQNVVLDAEAFRPLTHLKKQLPKHWIITPHEGEAARLLGRPAEIIRSDRTKSIQLLQKRFGCIILLKGHKTLITDGHEIIEIQSGNSSLAKAGTGDVLTGLITGLLSQGLAPLDAACLGAFVHGYASDVWLKEKNDHLSLLARDLLDLIPKAILRIRNSRAYGKSKKVLKAQHSK